MSRAFSAGQFVFRVFLILVDMGVNYQTLLTHRPIIAALSMDYVSFIVFFNAGMMLFIFLIDLIGAAWGRLRTNYIVGQGLTDLHRHEQ